MTLNIWWAADPAERYWMEITDRRDDLGEDLNAPTRNGAGREEWGYSLIAETRPGDIVFHWHKNTRGEPALAGWSEVVGPLSEEDNYAWQARGTFGRSTWRADASPMTACPRSRAGTREITGSTVATGTTDWQPEDEALAPTRFLYRLP